MHLCSAIATALWDCWADGNIDQTTSFNSSDDVNSQTHFPVVPLPFPWLSTSVLVVAMVSASAIRDICSILVKPGRLE